jgi:Glycosyl hydrolases family 16/Phage tail protein (Tail_P2_I)
MAVRLNESTNPSFETDLTGWTDLTGTASGSSWRDTSSHHTSPNAPATPVASLRINNATAQANGKIHQRTLAAGTYAVAVWMQVLANTTNAAFVVRRNADSAVLGEWHRTSPSNPWLRFGGFISVSSSTTVDFIVGVGIFTGGTSTGSARFDELLIERVGAAGMSTSGLSLPDYFDGSFVADGTTSYAWTGTAHASTSTASSGTPTPPAPPPTAAGWTLVETNDFTTMDQSTFDTRFYTKNGFAGTSGDGYYHTDRTTLSAAGVTIQPDQDFIGGFDSHKRPMIYGKWDVWFQETGGKGYKGVIFLWPDSEVWADGEYDFVEMTDSTGATFQIFFHKPGTPTDNSKQTRVSLNIVTSIQKVSMEWLPDRATVLANDIKVYEVANDSAWIAKKPMHLVVQVDVGIPNGHNGVSARANYPANLNPPFKVVVPRVDIYKPADASTTASLVVTDTGSSIDTGRIAIARLLEVNDAGSSSDNPRLSVSKLLGTTDAGSSFDTGDLTVAASATVIALVVNDVGTSVDVATLAATRIPLAAFDFGTSLDTADLSTTRDLSIRPEVVPLAEEIYAALGPLTIGDEATGWHLLRFVNAIAQAPQWTDDLVRDSDVGPGWSSVVDVDRAPADALAWLGQFIGVEVEPDIDAESQRLRIRETAGFRRGTKAAIEGAARQFLTGNRTVQVLERDTSPYHLKVITFETETPFPDRTEAAVQEQKPAGLVLQYVLSSGATYGELTATGDTYAELSTEYPTYTQLKLAIPA